MILAAHFFGCIIQGSFVKTATIVYPEIVMKFDVSATEAGLVSGIHGTFKMFSSKNCVFNILYHNLEQCLVYLCNGMLCVFNI